MQNLNVKLLEVLKQKNLDINLDRLKEKTPTVATNNNKEALRIDSSHGDLDSSSTLSIFTSPKFRVRSRTSKNQDEPVTPSLTTKNVGMLGLRPTTAMKYDLNVKTVSTPVTTSKGRPLTAQSGYSTSSSRGPMVRLESTRVSDDDYDNEINFIDMDRDNELDEKIREELEIFNDIAGLNEEKLAEIIGVEVNKLEMVTKVEMKVDLSFNSLQQGGEFLKSLRQLKLNNSIIASLRDIGNSFKNLEILWVSKCGLKDLAGLSSFPKLKELYAPYNNINDLSDIIFHSSLEILDLEGNDIQDLKTVGNLRTLDKLHSLALGSNPVCNIKDYEKQVCEILPQIQYLNDETRDEIQAKLSFASNNCDPEDINPLDDARVKLMCSKFKKFDLFAVEEFEENSRQIILNNINKEPTEEDIITMSVKKKSKKANAVTDDLGEFGRFSIKASTKKSLQRPQTSKARIGSKTASIFSDNGKLRNFAQEASDIINQTDQAFAGNPLKALRHRRKNQFTSGFENVKGENFSKPKDIIKLIEEFQVEASDDEDSNKRSEESSLPSSQTLDNDSDIQNKSATLPSEYQTEPQQNTGRAHSLAQRDLKSITKYKTFSQEREIKLEGYASMNPKEISIQDIRKHMNNTSNPRVKVQIKTKKSPMLLLGNSRTPVSIGIKN